MRTLYPPKLRRGATIGIVSPASPQRDVARLHRGIRYLEGLGYHVKMGEAALNVHGGYLAGTDANRARDIQEMFEDPGVDAIFCARGGYGSARILPLLNYERIRKNPKILVGFSDITALQLALWKNCKLVTFSGAMPSVDMADEFDSSSEEQFWRVLTSAKRLGALHQPWKMGVIQHGGASGRILGGNLSVLCSLLGTGYMPSMRGAILALEDVGEHTYRIDRMLTQLAYACKGARPAGVAYGFWSQRAPRRGGTPRREVVEVLAERLDITRGPIMSELMYGHEKTKLTLPFGAMASLDSTRRTLTLTESAVQ